MSTVVKHDSETPIRMADLSPEYAEIMILGKVLQASGYFKDVRDQAQAVTKILYGRELGISPINSMSAIHIIEGKPALSSNLLAALIKRSGRYDYRIKTWTDDACVLTFRQRTGDTWEDIGESSFTMEDAKRAGVVRSGGGWSKYPKAMLFARALSQGERAYCPDVSVCALYVPEELGATVNESGDVMELPASSRPIERTTEDIPIGGPAFSSGGGPEASGPETGTPQPPKPPEPTVEASLDTTIDLGRQANLHKAFRDALPNKDAKSQSDAFLYDWLKHQGYVDAEGKGTTKTIPMGLFEEVKAAAVKFAKGLK